MKAAVFQDVVPCRLVVGYQCFRTCSPDFLSEDYHKDEGPCSFENLNIYLPNYNIIYLSNFTVSRICQTAVSQYHLSIKLHCHSISHLWKTAVSQYYLAIKLHSVTASSVKLYDVTVITYQTTHTHIPEERSLDSHFHYSLRLHEHW